MQHNENDIIYDRFGEAQLRLMQSGYFATFGGEYVGFINNHAVYSISGKQVGWYKDGLVRDKSGRCVGFGELPVSKATPILPFKQVLPARKEPVEMPEIDKDSTDLADYPEESSMWSPLNLEKLFRT